MRIETKELLEELLLRTSVGFLATIDEGGNPEIRAVFNLKNPTVYPKPSQAIDQYEENPFAFYISTNTASIKMKQIEKNPYVSVYLSIPEEFKGIMIKGQVRVIDDINFKKNVWEENWTQYYPQGYTDPDFTMLRLEPKSIKGWYKGPHKHEFKK